MDLTFHIIFCPGQVRYLKLGVQSLLDHSELRFRLVGNGLDHRESEELAALSRTSRRLQFLPYPTRKMLPHGVLLSALQAREQAEHFCFMDSDIFAVSDFQRPLERQLAECDVFSSCSPIFKDSARIDSGFAGRCLQTPNGLALASTYFAVYRQEPLRQVIAQDGVGFEDYFESHLTDEIVKQLRSIGVTEFSWFDTGKLLNILSHKNDVRFRHSELDGLCHIGGITNALQGATWLKELRSNWFRSPYVLRDEDIDPSASWKSRILFAVNETGRGHFSNHSERMKKRRARLTRCRVAYFFAYFLKSLVDGTPEPRLEITDPSLTTRITLLCNSIREVHSASAVRHAA